MSGPTGRARRLWPVLTVLALLPVALAWPLPAVFRTHVLAAPDQEAAPHIWGLWAAAHTGSMLPIHTDLQAFPTGVELVLVDPFNVPAFHLGALWGPAAAYNFVLWCGLVLMGIAGALLALEWRASAWVGAVAAMACPTLLANAADGMTEGFGVGVVGIFAALLLRARRTGQRSAWVGAGLALGLTPWTGPYNAVWAALIGLGIAGSIASRGEWPTLRRTAFVGLGGILLGLPVGWSIFRSRDEALPGGGARSGLPEVMEHPEIYRGGVQTGADLIDPFLPVQLTGAEASVSHTAYQGVVLLGCAAVIAVRHPPARRWMAGALGFVALSFGPWLYWKGEVLQVGGAHLAGPAGIAMLAVPVFGRLTRWYRAGAVAGLMLAPLAARIA
ncbi:MAG TPA: hypothetical protein DFR83_23980, partial [Deltaproteobacteria bacterium]|nr:hypothetical protein [Deltaproteobacteria bacterium]